ncbi:HAD-IIIC family phosphatase [Anaerocolumna sp. AGMB13020]|uniref:HAD-IIIC family phosphatase n=1 Tax=Anaerocolumna sp. AGMB13020 TaxID=3081750 RepID=UPI002953226C|nr:HAD-IIIC family phosphatase [Anaerocolumna sp. AGMB13020]WOO34835.1 HAD-IIIC family phosphatase [Anaerocolumna sp. AGMB13020]
MGEKDVTVVNNSEDSRQESVMLISNITLEPYFSSQLEEIFLIHKIQVHLSVQTYEDFLIEEKKEELDKSDTVILWLDFNTLFPDIYNDFLTNQKEVEETFTGLLAVFCDFISGLCNACSTRLLMFGFEDYSIHFNSIWGYAYSKYNLADRMNRALSEGFSGRITVIDLKQLMAVNGIGDSLDNKLKYRWGNPYSRLLIHEAVQEIYKQYLIAHGISKKCIVLDCDNVLWGGILSEDGMENLQLGELGVGRRFQDFQRFLLQLYSCGVILAVSSKNDLEDVLKMFREHSGMILKEKHISCFQVNWENKCDSLSKISDSLNIGLESMVFIDDSIFEIEAVNKMLPMISTILFEKNTIYKELNSFNIPPNVDLKSVQIRNETYRSDILRQQLRAEYKSYEEYLDNLQMRVTISQADALSISRISELSQRTNKCTNGKRYTANELKVFMDQGLQLSAVYATDKFSELGLVGAIGVQDNNLALFCLSCRALGRNIEEQMISFIRDNYIISEVDFIPTSKNMELKKKLSELVCY